MWTWHLVSAVAATAALVVALDRLGWWLGGRDVAARWVRGWTALWWLLAVTATVGGPATAVAIGTGVAIVAVFDGLRRTRDRARELLVAAAAMAAGAPLWLAPPIFFDALVYHLGLPWSWLVNGSFAPIPHHLFSHFPLAASAVYLLPVTWGVPEAAAGLHWASFAVALAGSSRLAARLGAGRWSWLAAAALCGCWHLTWIATQAAADMVVLAALVVALDALADGPEPRWLDLGLGCGLAAATKYPAMVSVAALIGGGALLLGRHWRRWLATAAGAAATASFVPLRNLLLTGNPVYPLLWPLLGGTGWTARDDARYSELVREGVAGAGSLVTGLGRLFNPQHGLGWAALVCAVLAVAAVARAGPRTPARRLALVGGLMLVGWLVTSQTVRYAAPIAVVLAALAAAGLAGLGSTARRVAVAGLWLALMVGIVQLGEVALGVLQVHRLWRGNAAAWQAAVVVNDPLPAYRAAAALPADARLLVVGEGRSWGCPRPHHVSSPYDLQLIQELVEAAPSADQLAATLAAAGWTHLLINRGELARLGGPDFQLLRWRSAADAARWHELLRDWTTPVWQDDVCSLLRCRHAAAAASDPGGDL